jgi:hypothetical protein
MDMGLTGTAGSDLFFFLEVKLVPIETPPLTTTTDKGISVWGACNPGTYGVSSQATLANSHSIVLMLQNVWLNILLIPHITASGHVQVSST